MNRVVESDLELELFLFIELAKTYLGLFSILTGFIV